MEIKDGTIYLSEEEYNKVLEADKAPVNKEAIAKFIKEAKKEELGGITEYPTDFDITQIMDTQYYETKQTKATVKYWKLEKKEEIK